MPLTQEDQELAAFMRQHAQQMQIFADLLEDEENALARTDSQAIMKILAKKVPQLAALEQSGVLLKQRLAHGSGCHTPAEQRQWLERKLTASEPALWHHWYAQLFRLRTLATHVDSLISAQKNRLNQPSSADLYSLQGHPLNSLAASLFLDKA